MRRKKREKEKKTNTQEGGKRPEKEKMPEKVKGESYEEREKSDNIKHKRGKTQTKRQNFITGLDTTQSD